MHLYHEDDTSPTDATRPERRGRTRLLVAGALTATLFLVAALLLAYKGSTHESLTPGGESAAAEGGGAAGGIQGAQAEPTTTQAPDRLPDPTVGSGTCKMVTYTPPFAREKEQGELCRPIGAQRDVAVVIVHGGAGVAGTYAGMKPWSNRLNTEGYVTFAVDYHLFTDGTAGPVFPWPEQNVKAAVQYLRGTANALGIRNDHIAVEGFSSGARLGAEAFTTADDPYFAGNELWPYISDEVNSLIAFYHPLDGSMQYQDQYYGGNDSSLDPAVIKRWDLADSLSHADHAKGPALFMTGSDDWDIQITQMATFVQTMQGIGQQAGIIVVPGGGHGFDQGDGYRLSRLGENSATAVLNFLNKAFPQIPERPAQAVSPDVINAPNFTGAPPSTFVPRPRATSPASAPYRYTTLPQSSVPKKAPVVPPTATLPPVTKPSTSVSVPPTTPPTISVPESSVPPSSTKP